MRISDWSSDVCSSDLKLRGRERAGAALIGELVVAAVAPSERHVEARADMNGRIRKGRIFLIGRCGENVGELRHHRIDRQRSRLEHVDTLKDAALFMRVVAADQQIGRASCRERVCQYV